MVNKRSLTIYSLFDNLSADNYSLLSNRAQSILADICDEQVIQAPENYQIALIKEVLKRLSISDDIEKISHFTFREFESFLKDQNDQEAFGAHLKAEFIVVFGQVRLELIADIFKNSLLNNELLMSELSEMAHDFSLVAKNRYAHAVVGALGLRLVFANEDEIVISGSKIGLSSVELETILHNVFTAFSKLEDLKVVAV